MNYVCGFYFSYDLNEFLLIHKRGEGRWNGVGGKIECERDPFDPEGGYLYSVLESPHAAMVREFQEETGIITLKHQWTCFYIQEWKNKNKVYFFAAFGDQYKKAIQTTDEPLRTFNVPEFYFDDPSVFSWDLFIILPMVLRMVKKGCLVQLDPEGVNSAR